MPAAPDTHPFAPATTHHLLTRREAAAYLGVTEGTLAVWASTRRYDLPFIKVGRHVRYRVADLDAWLQARTVGGR